MNDCLVRRELFLGINEHNCLVKTKKSVIHPNTKLISIMMKPGQWHSLYRFIHSIVLIACCSGAFCPDNASRAEGLYIVDQGNHRIRVVSPIGVAVSTLAGNGAVDVMDGHGTSASFRNIAHSALSRDGNVLYVTDGSCVRSVYLRDGFFSVKRVVGNCVHAGNILGHSSVARISSSLRIFSDFRDRGIYISDSTNHFVRYFNFTSESLSNIAGTGGSVCGQEGRGTSVPIPFPGALYVSNNGSFVLFSSQSMNIYLYNTTSLFARVFAGGCSSGSQDGVGTSARFHNLTSFAIRMSDESRIFVADRDGQLLRIVTFPNAVVTTVPLGTLPSVFGIISFSFHGLELYSVMNQMVYHTLNLSNSSITHTLGARGFSDGTFRSGNALFNSLSSCNVGHLYNFSACARCTAGQYQNLSQQISLFCLPCPAGTFNSFSDSSSCVSCAPGTFSRSASSVCTHCERGSYSPHNGMSTCFSCSSGAYSTALTWCPSNTFAPSLITSIYQCTAMAGFYGNPGSPAVACPYDYYCPAQSVSPIPCPPGHTTSGMRSIAAANCTPWMAIPCRPGFYMDFSFYMNFSSTPFCSPCPMGSYCPGDSVIVSCISSTAFHYSRSNSTLASDCVTNPVTSSASLLCPDNTHPSTAVVSLMQCQANAGYYYIAGSIAAASLCPRQYYCPFRTVAPVPCPSIVGAVCQMGQYPPRGSRCPSNGMAAPLDACLSCIHLPSNAAWASSTDDLCPFCCDAFFHQFGHGACNRHPNTSSCPENQFMPIPPSCATGLRICMPCPPSTDPELRLLNATHRNTFLRDSEGLAFGQCHFGCAPGYFGSYQVSQSKTSCIECGPGFYKDYTGDAASCILCEDGKFASGSRASGCLTCTPFSTSNALRTGCVCMAGTFPVTDGNGSLLCVPCPSGSISAAGDSACRSCSAGTLLRRWCPNPCLAGHFGVCLQDGSHNCTACAAGTFSRESGQSSPNTCIPCTAGTFSGRGAMLCTPCSAGHFATGTGLNRIQDCLQCSAGTYGLTGGSTACTACSAGKFSTSVGATLESNCTQCLAGTYALTAGATHCVQCNAGTFSSTTGASLSSVCIQCLAGSFSASAGASSCVMCNPATFTGSNGSTGCQSFTCAAGQYSSSFGLPAAGCLTCGTGTFRSIPSWFMTAPMGWASGPWQDTDCRFLRMTHAPAYVCTNGLFIWHWPNWWVGAWHESWVGGRSVNIIGPVASGWEFSLMSHLLNLVTGPQYCRTCQICPAGSFTSTICAPHQDNACTPCAAGQFSNATNTSVCVSCASGTFSSGTGQTSANACTACAPGFFSPSGAANCTN